MNLFARLQKPVCFLFFVLIQAKHFFEFIILAWKPIHKRKLSSIFTILFGELCKQNLFFLSLPELAFMFLVIKSQLSKILFCIINTVKIINILIKCNL